MNPTGNALAVPARLAVPCRCTSQLSRKVRSASRYPSAIWVDCNKLSLPLGKMKAANVTVLPLSNAILWDVPESVDTRIQDPHLLVRNTDGRVTPRFAAKSHTAAQAAHA